MEHITEISENINTPRYITQVSEGKAYLSEWGTDVIHVIDLNNYEIIKSISVGQDPEEIVVSNGLLMYVIAESFVLLIIQSSN